MRNSEFWDASFTDVDNVVHSLARKVAKQYHLNWTDHGEDLVSCGWVGVMRAKEKYQPQGYKFISYAYHFMNGCIRREALAITKRIGISADFSELDHMTSDDMLDQIALKEILKTTEGIALLADELRDEKQSATVRRKQRSSLRQAYEEMK